MLSKCVIGPYKSCIVFGSVLLTILFFWAFVWLEFLKQGSFSGWIAAECSCRVAPIRPLCLLQASGINDTCLVIISRACCCPEREMVHFPWYMTVVIWFSIKVSLHTCEAVVCYRVLLRAVFSSARFSQRKHPAPCTLVHHFSTAGVSQTNRKPIRWDSAIQASVRCGGCQGLPVLRHLIYAFQMWKEFPGGVRETKKAIQIRTQRNLTFVFGPTTVFSFTALSLQDKAESSRSLGNTARRSFISLCSPLVPWRKVSWLPQGRAGLGWGWGVQNLPDICQAEIWSPAIQNQQIIKNNKTWDEKRKSSHYHTAFSFWKF